MSSVLGALAWRFGQPRVVGQIVAGILLGPSVLGRLPGHLTSRLFPHAALAPINVLAQVAIVFFMFAVGYELEWVTLRGRHRAPLLVAGAALVVPMGLGIGAATLLRSQFAAVGQAHFGRPFLLFMGVAVSITALPVLAAILRERGMTRTTAGVTATAAAGIMDVVAWLVLAGALVRSAHQRPWWLSLLLIAAFAAVMLLAVRPLLRWALNWYGTAYQLPVAVMLALGSAWVTATLGLHPVFGAFLAGLTMPRQDPALLRPLQDLGQVLLPLFFIATGLSTNIGALNGSAFAVLGIVCAIAVAGKIGPGYLGSRLGGLDRKDAATVSVLVGTRGLTELIVLNVGLATGVIVPRLFSVLVLMALVTTIITAPLLSLIRAPSNQTSGELPAKPVEPVR